MDVTRNNFKELLPEIEESIWESSFVCVDGEFTGISNEGHISAYDSTPEYYRKTRSGALDFLFIQFGLAIFKRDPQTKKYKCKVYNFYIFPRPMRRSAPDHRFLCQASSIDFLSNHGFDFNKVFKEGIPYLSRSGEEKMREGIAERRRYQAASTEAPVPVPQHLKSQVETICDQIGELFKSDSGKEEVTIEKTTAFVRKLVYQTLRERYGETKLEVETVNGQLVAKRSKGKTKEEREEEMRVKDEADINEAVGFSKVIRAITASDKLVVGHNILLDICHMVHQFCDPLPEDYMEFKDMMHCLFPRLLDTKLLCSVGPLKELIRSSILEHIIDEIKKEDTFEVPEIETEGDFSYDLDLNKYHDAGFDAFSTGVCFISLTSYLQSQEGDKTPIEDSDTLKPYLNKIFLTRTPDTYMNVSGEDPEPERDHVFHLTFPENWSNKNIYDLFSPFGNVQVSWIDQSSAWVALYEKDKASKAASRLCKGRGPARVVPYSQAINVGRQSGKRKRQDSPPQSPMPQVGKWELFIVVSLLLLLVGESSFFGSYYIHALVAILIMGFFMKYSSSRDLTC